MLLEIPIFIAHMSFGDVVVIASAVSHKILNYIKRVISNFHELTLLINDKYLYYSLIFILSLNDFMDRDSWIILAIGKIAITPNMTHK